MKRWMAAMTLLVIASGPIPCAWADTVSGGVEDIGFAAAIPGLMLTAANGTVLLIDEGSTFLGVLGILTGTFTAFLGAMSFEPEFMAVGAASLVTGYYSARRASDRRHPTFDLAVAPGSYRASLCLRF
jgi:hypothetical protein